MPQRTTVDERARSGRGDRDDAPADDEPGIPRLLPEPPVEAVRELRGAHRPEPVDDGDRPGGADSGVPQQPLAGPCRERRVERGVEERPRPEGAPADPRFAPRADQPDRAGHAGLRHGQHRGRGLVPCHPADVDAGDRRSDGDRPTLRERDAAEGGRREHEHQREHAHHEWPAAAPPRGPGAREKEVGHPAEPSRGSVKNV